MAVDYVFTEYDYHNSEKNARFFAEDLTPQLMKYWDKVKHLYADTRFEANALTWMQLWANSALGIICAYDNNKAVGCLICSYVKPLIKEAQSTSYVEILQGDTPDIEKGLLEYLVTIMPFFNSRDLRLQVPSPVENIKGVTHIGSQEMHFYRR